MYFKNKMVYHHTIDEIKETFIDINMDRLLDLYDDIKTEHEDQGFLNTSNSSDFIHILVDNLIFNDTFNDNSSDDENG